jgi:hypothetical protein
MTRRARYRIEVKSRLEEDLYAGLQAYKALNNMSTDSETVARILRLFLFGTVGTLPASLVAVSSHLGQEGITVTI